MRLKHSHNFLGSGCSFRYRGIFSGLSNETVGAASYTSPPPAMDPSIHQLITSINTYQHLLHRYACSMVKNKLVAAVIVEETFLAYSLQVVVIPPTSTRKFLKEYTLTSCNQWLKAKNKTLIMRKPKNPT